MHNIRKQVALAWLLLLIAFPAMAQQKSFTLDDLMWGGKNYWNIMPRSTFTAWWGDRLVKTTVNNAVLLYNEQGRSVKDAPFLTTESINAAIDTKKYGQVRNLAYASFPEAERPVAALATDKGTIYYNWQSKQVEWFKASIHEAQAEKQSPLTKRVAYVKGWNLYVRDAQGNDQQVTKDGSRELQYGMSVHRDEFGIHEGLFWSPKGNLLAFYRMDQTMVTDFPLIDIDNRVAQLAPEKYPMAGMTSHKVTVGVYDPATQKTLYLQAGDPTDRYFTNIAWSPDEAIIYMFELPRTQDKAELVAYDAHSGKRLGVLYTETNARYVEPMNPIVFLPWDSKLFVMQSQKDGYNHLYIYNIGTGAIRQLTKGNFVVEDFCGFNTKNKSVIIATNEANPIQRNIYTVDVKSGKRKSLDNSRGCHNASLSKSGQWIVDMYSEPDVPRNYDLVATANAKSLRLLTSKDPWEGYQQPIFESGSIKAADGTTDLYWRMVKPADFDASKKYPTVVYVYGGPHAHNVEASWHWYSRSWETYMAQKGYIVFILDNRGSENRGLEFEQATWHKLGKVEMLDQMKGVDYIKSLPYVDANRLGVHGWSYGGFMTISLMTNYPDVFKVGVAGGPVIDWRWYEVMYGERYMGTPDTNKEGIEACSLIPMAKNLKGKLQIIIGMNDPTVVPQHALSFIDACTEAGTQPDFFVYPGEGHNMMGHKSVHLHERITQYFEDYLK
ncbi:MAG: DPP IV N-terminal domain-containing protein [Bacteroidales bacterium]|nr:DPP IV N-terminal domain-containing protein [Bacteroidales bacterium]